jgi:hypothetical protein
MDSSQALTAFTNLGTLVRATTSHLHPGNCRSTRELAYAQDPITTPDKNRLQIAAAKLSTQKK